MCFGMPPRKKQRLSGGKQQAASVAAGADTTAVAMSCDELPELMKSCLQVLEAMYSLRHADSSTIHLAEAGPLKPKDGLFEWPIAFGGTFKSIAQRAWADQRISCWSCRPRLLSRLSSPSQGTSRNLSSSFAKWRRGKGPKGYY